MGASKNHRNLAKLVHRLENTGERRAGKLDADVGHQEHRDTIISIEDARRRKLIVNEGICPETNKPYSSIATHRKALDPYFDGLSTAEWTHIKSVIWHKINPNTDSILVHPAAGKKLARV